MVLLCIWYLLDVVGPLFATRRYSKLLGGFWDPMLIQNESHLCLIVPGKLVDMWSLSLSHGKEMAGRLNLSHALPWYHFCVLMCHFQAYFCKASCNVVLDSLACKRTLDTDFVL